MAEDTPMVESDQSPREKAPSKEPGASPAEGQPSEEMLRSELAEFRRSNEELLTRLKYLQAEYENYRKRVEKEAEAVLRLGQEALLSRILPVLDELDAAVESLDGKAQEGVRMVRENLRKVLQETGVQEIPALGQAFDPWVHECVQQVRDAGSKDGTVKEVVRKGYRLPDRILRPAQVIVVNNGGEEHG